MTLTTVRTLYFVLPYLNHFGFGFRQLCDLVHRHDLRCHLPQIALATWTTLGLEFNHLVRFSHPFPFGFIVSRTSTMFTLGTITRFVGFLIS